jgi:APA family basic amino acid/polyamine antiporter
LVGWTDWLNFVAGIGALSIVCAEYLALVVPKVAGSEGLLGAAIAIFLFALNWAGVRQGSLTQIFTTLAKVVLLSALIGLVFTSPAMRHAATNPRPLSLFGIIVAYQIIYGVYSGWASPAYFAEEHTAPSRNIPRSLVMSLLLITSLYVLINAALIHALPIERLRASNLPAAEAIANLLGPTSIKLVVLVALVTVISCINAGIMTGVRILHGLSQEGLLPSAFSHVNRGGTPDVAMGTTALAAILLALSGQFETVFLAMSALVIFSLAMTDASLFRLRRTAPDLPRPYRARGYPWLPALVLLLDAGLVVAFLARDLRSGAFLLLAVVICVPLGRMKRWSNE